ncbi:insulin-induced gene 2 protein-like [Xenia sp. Carnegie-2017]|uniref:insulin-induced gene 2 protein-like n=1 Tax=Xenia sp. Carnegie-2017 TaxID=2897299 RepID=UPI001F04E2D7|nr:insulin-induced gene 2 protein-like [Xenia sp. Carnegie-2017]
MVLKMKKSFPLFVNSVCRPATLNFFIRAFCLFIFGLLISCVLNVMLILPELRRKVVFERELVERLYSTLWWFAPSCGLASSIVGMMYPCTDMRFGQPHHLRNEWSSVVRCEVLFFGIIHAAVKLRFKSELHLFVTAAVFSIFLWWYFDRSTNGFGLAFLVSVFSTISVWHLGSYSLFSLFFRKKIAFVNQLWVPCLFFSAVIAIGKIGRQLAMLEYVPAKVKLHTD